MKKILKKVLTDILYSGIVLLVLERGQELRKRVSLKERRKLKKFFKKRVDKQN